MFEFKCIFMHRAPRKSGFRLLVGLDQTWFEDEAPLKGNWLRTPTARIIGNYYRYQGSGPVGML